MSTSPYSNPLTITRQSILDQLAELDTLATEIYDHCTEAHKHHYLDTMDFFKAGEQVAAVWRAYEYARASLQQ